MKKLLFQKNILLFLVALLIFPAVLAQDCDPDTTLLARWTCDPNQVGVTDITYTNHIGCDSVVIITTTLIPGDTTNVAAWTCDPSQVGVTEYLYTNHIGCDSLVIITTTLIPGDTTNVAATTCDPDKAGVTEYLYANHIGCDSLVIITTTLLPIDTINLAATTCDPAQAGVTLQILSNIFGCDSVVITTTTLLPSDTTNLAATTCDPAQAGVTQHLYTNIFGCDSLVITTTTLIEDPVIESISAPTDPISINTTIDVTAVSMSDYLQDAVWEWGDGTSSPGQIGTEITGDHTYTDPGVYTLTLTLINVCGDSVSSSYQYIVVYDPNGGFVTGGGWIDSPVGASTQYPDAVGKANFGFVSKYKKGAEVPTGKVKFHFKKGNIKFKAKEYDWLVINGSRALFQGTGSIKKSGDYRFLVSAIDGDLIDSGTEDKLRLKIWEIANPDNIVYDNEIGVPELDNPTTELGGGSIVIHKGSNKKSEAIAPIENKVESLSLIEIYPNPFSNTAYIEFQHNESIELMINVYDLGGRLIENLHEGGIKDGVRYRFEFTPEGIASGTFIVKFIMDNNNVITNQ